MTLNCIGFFTLLSLLLYGCSTPFMGKGVYGAEEFVIDSYKIKEGKFSILEMEGSESDELSLEYLEEYKDVIHDDDILGVVVYHPKRSDLTEHVHFIGQTVGYQIIDGKIYLPDLPPIHIEGLSLIEAKEKIQSCYLKQMDDVEVFLSYQDRKIKRVELAGLVRIPSVAVNGKIRLFDVLAQAQVPTNANLFKSYVMREGKFLPVDLFKLLKKGDMSQNIVMRGGDKIYIAEPSAASLMVMGEVGCECVIDLPHGFMSLREALAQAKGVPFTGDKSYIQIIRGNISKPKIYTVNWEHIIHLPNDSLLLMPGDVVYVSAKPITEWNRFISQLFPSLTWFQAIGNGCRSWGIFIP